MSQGYHASAICQAKLNGGGWLGLIHTLPWCIVAGWCCRCLGLRGSCGTRPLLITFITGLDSRNNLLMRATWAHLINSMKPTAIRGCILSVRIMVTHLRACCRIKRVARVRYQRPCSMQTSTSAVSGISLSRSFYAHKLGLDPSKMLCVATARKNRRL